MEKKLATYLSSIQLTAVVMYFSGIVIHSLRFILDKQPSEFVPKLFDLMILLLSFYVGFSTSILLILRSKSQSNRYAVSFYWFKVGFLIVTQIIHLIILTSGNNEILNVFPPWYSIFVLFFFSFSGIMFLKIRSFLVFDNPTNLASVPGGL